MNRGERVDWLCRLRADLNNGVIFTPWNKEFTEALDDVLEQEPMVEIDLDYVIKQKYIEREALDKMIEELRMWELNLTNELGQTSKGVFSQRLFEIIEKYRR